VPFRKDLQKNIPYCSKYEAKFEEKTMPVEKDLPRSRIQR